MFGAIEQPEHWANHIVRTRALQAETGGFTEFVPLPFVHMAAPIYLQRRARRGPTFREALLMHPRYYELREELIGFLEECGRQH